ncbi:MAG: hypothetical protein ACOC85_01355 [Thermoplasmatota archaeon]
MADKTKKTIIAIEEKQKWEQRESEILDRLKEIKKKKKELKKRAKKIQSNISGYKESLRKLSSIDSENIERLKGTGEQILR